MILRAIIVFFATVHFAFANDLKVVTHTNTGGFTIHARVFAQHLQKYVASKTVSIKIVPGAAGIASANYLYNIAPKDGSEFGTINTKVLTQGLAKNENVKYDLRNFGWIGSAIDGRKEPFVFWGKLGAKNIIAGSEGGFSINHIKLVNSILRWEMQEVIGYAESGQVRLAFEKDEINLVAYNLTGIRTTAPHWLGNNKILPLIQYGAGFNRNQNLLSVPTAMEFAKTDEEKNLLEIFENLLILGRAFAAPPGVPADQLANLRNLFEKVINDEQYRQDALKIGVVVSPVFWEESQKIIEKISFADENAISNLQKF